MNNKSLASNSILIAIYCVLSILTPIKIINFKLTFEALPILVGGLLLGPINGLIIGGIGSLIYQIFLSGYGISVTTILWVLPHALSGLIVGLYAKKLNYNLSFKQISFISIISTLLVTSLNSLALYIDSLIYGYYYLGLILGGIFIKITIGILLAIIYSLIMPKLLTYIKKI